MNEQLEPNKAHKIHSEILQLKLVITKDFLELGKRLYLISRNKLFKSLDYNTFATYLASPEVSISLSTAYELIDIYKTMLLRFNIEEQKLLPIGRSKLGRILSVVNENNFEDWLAKAEVLSVTDLENELKELRGKKVFEFKYTKPTLLSFKGDTKMEELLEKKLDLKEWRCAKCENVFWTNKIPAFCSYCSSKEFNLNGEIKYKDILENAQKEN